MTTVTKFCTAIVQKSAILQTLTRPDVEKVALRHDVMTNTRCDALFKKETVHLDVHRSELAYTSRLLTTFCVYNFIL
jgi:hypothetical protein